MGKDKQNNTDNNIANNLLELYNENILHDIKTQLLIVYTAMQLMESTGELDIEKSKNSKVLVSGIERMVKLLNDFDNTRNMVDKTYSLYKMKYNLSEIITDIVAELETIAKLKAIKISIESNIETEVIYTDKGILDRILLNLLSNAIKYSTIGGEVIVRLEEISDNILITVEDSGLGIDEDNLELIFERYKVFNTNSGTGIGLAIVKELLNLLEGQVYAKNNIDKNGASITVSFPIQS